MGAEPACAAVRPCTTHEQTLYQRMCSGTVRTAVHIYCCVRTPRTGGVERRGEAKTAIPVPLWHGSAYHLLLLFFLVVHQTIPSPASGIVPRIFCGTAVVYCCCRTHIMGSWVVDVFFLCSVLGCTTAVPRTAVVLLLYRVAGWIGTWACPWVRVFFPFVSLTLPAIPAPRWHSSPHHY